MILLFTDFGIAGPYVGQMKLALYQHAPGVPVVDLIADVPPFRPLEAAYLLAALARNAPAESVYLCVIDPGVGSTRLPLVAKADEFWYVGPDNGLLDVVISCACQHQLWKIDWRPEALSQSFHGRDLFAPVAGMLAAGKTPEEIGCQSLESHLDKAPADCARVIYIDHFGNVMIGVRAQELMQVVRLKAGGRWVAHANTFSDVAVGEPFWYRNSLSLIEIAVNQGSAAALLGLGVGDTIEVANSGSADPAAGG